MPMTAKQIRFFGTKAQKAALRRKRAGSRSTPRPRRATTKRTTMPRKKGRSRGRKKASIAEVIVGANAAVQIGEPFVPAAMAAMNGDIPGAIAAAKPALKEAAGFKNIGQAAAPGIVLGVAKKLGAGRLLGRVKVMGRRLI